MDINALRDIVMELVQYGMARDRTIEREPRTITITDDDALLLLEALGTFDHPLMKQLTDEREN